MFVYCVMYLHVMYRHIYREVKKFSAQQSTLDITSLNSSLQVRYGYM